MLLMPIRDVKMYPKIYRLSLVVSALFLFTKKKKTGGEMRETKFVALDWGTPTYVNS